MCFIFVPESFGQNFPEVSVAGSLSCIIAHFTSRSQNKHIIKIWICLIYLCDQNLVIRYLIGLNYYRYLILYPNGNAINSTSFHAGTKFKNCPLILDFSNLLRTSSFKKYYVLWHICTLSRFFDPTTCCIRHVRTVAYTGRRHSWLYLLSAPSLIVASLHASMDVMSHMS